MDAGHHLMALPAATETGAALGFPGAGMARALGLILLVCTVLYIAPRTTVPRRHLAECLSWRCSGYPVARRCPLVPHILFGVYPASCCGVGSGFATRGSGRCMPLLGTETAYEH